MQTLGEWLVWMFIFFGLGMWSIGKLFGRFDTGGVIKTTAQKGAADLIRKWLK